MKDYWWPPGRLTFTPPERNEVLVSKPKILNGRVIMEVSCGWPLPPASVIGTAVADCVDDWVHRPATK